MTTPWLLHETHTKNTVNCTIFYKSIKFCNTYYGLHHLQELLYNATGTNIPMEQKAVSTPRELAWIKERKKYLNLKTLLKQHIRIIRTI